MMYLTDKTLLEVAGKLVTVWGLVAKRSLAHWKLLSAVLIGVVLASAIMSGTVIYFDALRELALKRALTKHTTAELDILLSTRKGPTSRAEYDNVSDLANNVVDARVGWMLRDRVRAGKTPTFFIATTGNEDQAGTDNSRTFFIFLPELPDHAALQPGGTFPRGERLSAPGEPPEVEAVVSREAAQLFDVGVGSRLLAVPTQQDAVPYVSVVISGVFEKAQPVDEEFWYLEQEVVGAARGSGSLRHIPFYVSETAFLDVVGPSFRKLDSTYLWLLKTDIGRVNARNAEAALVDIEQMSRTLVSVLPSYGHRTALDNVLSEYDRRIFFSKLPMFVVLILIAVVVLYYIATLSSLVVDNRRSEVALLRSRGSSFAQILTVFVLEGLTIAALAAVVAPLIAAIAIGALGYVPAFSDLTGGARLSVSITGGAYVMSAIGGVLSFVTLIIPAAQASRIGVTQERAHAARPSSLPAFQRYYLDVLLLLISILLFRLLTEQGSVVATNQLGESTANELLLAFPGLVLVASAMVLLRLFPPAMRLASRLLSHALPAGPTMGLWQIARDPTHYARLSLLLILTAGLGIFASSFEATLERSFEERVLFSTGSDIKLERVRLVSDTTTSQAPGQSRPADPEGELVEAFEQIPGIERVSPVVRVPGRDLTTASVGGYEMFAIDGESFGEVAWFRDDFSDEPIEDLLRSLKVLDTPEGLELPIDASTIGVRVKADRLHPTVRIAARLRNAVNQHSNYTLGALSSREWMVIEADLDVVGRQSFLSSRPLTLVSLQLVETGLDRSLLAGSMLIDDIRVTTATGERIIVEDFEDASEWKVLRNTPDAASDELRASDEIFDGESGSATFFWSAGGPLTARGIFHGPERMPLPVLGSKAFVKSTGHSIGEEFEVEVARSRVPVRLVGTVDLFPTMSTLDKRLLVADITALDRYANLPATESELFPIELWISTTASGAEREELLQSLKGVPGYRSGPPQDRAARLAVLEADPLVQAGWSALLFIAFSAVLILSCVGFLIHAYVSFRNREHQFGLLRTVGFSTAQLTTMVWLEQALVIAVGLALGTWMGGRLGAAVMPFLGHSDFGGQVIPPFAVQVNWGALLITYAAMVFVFAVIILAVIWFIQKISLHRVLRIGEA